MDLAEKIATNARPHLGAGERIIAAFPAQTENQVYLIGPVLTVMFLGIAYELPSVVEVPLILLALVPVGWFFRRNKNLTVVATDRRTIVGSSGMLSSSEMNEVLHELGPDVKIGPASGFMHTTDALGPSMRVHRRFHDQIERADARNA